jgi:hypothetical protein
MQRKMPKKLVAWMGVGELYNHAVESCSRSQAETVRQRSLVRSVGKAHLYLSRSGVPCPNSIA